MDLRHQKWFSPWESEHDIENLPEIEAYSKTAAPDFEIRSGGAVWRVHRVVVSKISWEFNVISGIDKWKDPESEKSPEDEQMQNGNGIAGDNEQDSLRQRRNNDDAGIGTDPNDPLTALSKSVTLPDSARGWAHVLSCLYRLKGVRVVPPNHLYKDVDPGLHVASIVEGINVAKKYCSAPLARELAGDAVDVLMTAFETPLDLRLDDIWCLLMFSIENRRNFGLLYWILDTQAKQAAQKWAQLSPGESPRDSFAFFALTERHRKALRLSASDEAVLIGLQQKMQQSWFRQADEIRGAADLEKQGKPALKRAAPDHAWPCQ